MSQTARVALRGSGNETTPTDVVNLGTNRIVAGGGGGICNCQQNRIQELKILAPSVTIPSVPSAPMNNLVRSNPAEHFRARCRVFITSPEGRTAVLNMIC